MLTSTELRTALKISQSVLTGYVRRGLPWHGKNPGRPNTQKLFDECEVTTWLLNEGVAKQTETAGQTDSASPSQCQSSEVVATKKADAAKLIGCSVRALGDWLEYADFPGRAGLPGRGEGYFPIEKIIAWRKKTFGAAQGKQNPTLIAARLKNIEESTRAKRLRNDMLEGLVYPADEVEQNAAQLTSRIRSSLEQIPDQIEQELPPKIRAQIKSRIADKITGILREMSAWRIEESKGVVQK